MCSLSQGVENRGIAKGVILGRAEGILQGTENAQLSCIRSLMQNLNISAEQAMPCWIFPQKTAAILPRF